MTESWISKQSGPFDAATLIMFPFSKFSSQLPWQRAAKSSITSRFLCHLFTILSCNQIKSSMEKKFCSPPHKLYLKLHSAVSGNFSALRYSEINITDVYCLPHDLHSKTNSIWYWSSKAENKIWWNRLWIREGKSSFLHPKWVVVWYWYGSHFSMQLNLRVEIATSIQRPAGSSMAQRQRRCWCTANSILLSAVLCLHWLTGIIKKKKSTAGRAIGRQEGCGRREGGRTMMEVFEQDGL